MSDQHPAGPAHTANLTVAGDINLAAMLDQVATQVAHGRMGDVHGCAIFLTGDKSNCILTLPIEPPEVTAARFERAVQWLRTGVLPP